MTCNVIFKQLLLRLGISLMNIEQTEASFSNKQNLLKTSRSFFSKPSRAIFRLTTIATAKDLILDLICVAAAGSQTPLSAKITDHAVNHFGAGKAGVPILFDGRMASPVGAALAGGMMIDSVDAHDGYKLCKGHVGCALLPSVLALAQATNLEDGAEFLHRIVLGYEIGSRAGVALHASVADYHTSGAWMAVTCAALGARALGMDVQTMREAIGIAEYHGPRSQMMRAIDHPTMVKDGSGWGAMAGTSAVFLAQDGFTGAPAITIEGDDVAHHWADLGERWLVNEQYIKPYPVCRWAQAPVEAARSLIEKHNLTSNDIEYVECDSFHEAIRLATSAPETTEQAQYSLPFPVAAMIVKGKLGPEEINGESLKDPEILRLSTGMKLDEQVAYNEKFPANRIASVIFGLRDGTRLESGPFEARGDPEEPFSSAEMREKFHTYTAPVLGEKRATAIENAVDSLEIMALFQP